MSQFSTDEDFAGRANFRAPPETETEAEASVVVGAVDEKDKRKRHRKKRYPEAVFLVMCDPSMNQL
jgi:hypothetical protein